MEEIVAQIGDVGVGFRRGLAIGPELKLVMFGVHGSISPARLLRWNSVERSRKI